MSKSYLKKQKDKIYICFLIPLILSHFAPAQCQDKATFVSVNSEEKTGKPHWTHLEVKGGYFFFASSKMRKIYNQGGADVQIAVTYPLCSGKGRLCLDIYGSLEYLERSGHSLNYNYKTSIWEIPVNLGLRPVFAISKDVHYYFTLGPRYFYVHQHNKAPYVSNNQGKSGLGLFINTGFDFILGRHFLLDIFGEYSYASLRFHPSKENVYNQSIQVGGFTFGGGLGYAF